MKSLKKKAIVVAMTLSFSGSVFASGVPVGDAGTWTTVGLVWTEVQNTIIEAERQYDEYMKAVNQFKKLKDLDFEAEDVYSLVLDGDMSKIPYGDELKERFMLIDLCEKEDESEEVKAMDGYEEYVERCKQKQERLYGSLAAATEIGKQLDESNSNIRKFASQLNGTHNEKMATQISGRINAELANVQSLTLQLESLNTQLAMMEEVDKQQSKEGLYKKEEQVKESLSELFSSLGEGEVKVTNAQLDDILNAN